MLEIGEWKGFIDVLFMMQYNDMMGPASENGAQMTRDNFGFGFKSVNIGNSRIQGVEISLQEKAKLGKLKYNYSEVTPTQTIIEDVTINMMNT